jgi:acyl-coenzyme A synthetase/AMP-(fatty) acid ligase
LASAGWPEQAMPAGLKSVLERCRSNPQQAFIAGGCSRARVFSLAASICSLKQEGPLCLCSADKAIVAAALLAAAHGGPHLVLPYAFSRQALLKAREAMHFNRIISDTAEHELNEATVITPEMLAGKGRLPDKPCHPDEPIALLFTGGSTGKPKGWSKTLRNLFGEAGFLTDAFGIAPDDIILSTVPPQHIYGLLFCALVPLIAGCAVLEPVYTFPQEILDAAHTQSATILVSVPVQYHVLKVDNLRRHALRMAFSSAGVLRSRDADFFHAKTGIAVTEIFGSTETGGIAWRRSPGNSSSWQPFENVQWKIEKQLLLARSDFLSPELPRDRDGFFATADRAEPCGAGSFTLHGRADDIVKVGGKRVDLAEVCAKIRQIDGVEDAVVFAMPTHRGRGSEIAALVAGGIETSWLRKQLSEICEPYASPRHIKIVEAIPALATGKHDRGMIEKFFNS